MEHAPSEDLAKRYLVDDLPGARQSGARLNGILVKIDVGTPITQWSLQFLSTNRLDALAALVGGELQWEAYLERADNERAERIAQASEKADRDAAEMAEREQALAAEISANFAAMARDPRHRRSRESKELRHRYGLGYVEQDHFPRVMALLRQLANGQRITAEDIVWLQTEADYCWTSELQKDWHRLEAAALTKAWKEGGDAWNAVNASSHWRKAGEPERALELTEAASTRGALTPKLEAALDTTRGGAMRDLGRISDAKLLALQAHKLTPEDYRPCTLLGAVHMELGDFVSAQEWFTRAEDLGASRESVEREIRALFSRCSAQEQQSIRDQLLALDPERFGWLIRGSKKSAPAGNLKATRVVGPNRAAAVHSSESA